MMSLFAVAPPEDKLSPEEEAEYEQLMRRLATNLYPKALKGDAAAVQKVNNAVAVGMKNSAKLKRESLMEDRRRKLKEEKEAREAAALAAAQAEVKKGGLGGGIFSAVANFSKSKGGAAKSPAKDKPAGKKGLSLSSSFMLMTVIVGMVTVRNIIAHHHAVETAPPPKPVAKRTFDTTQPFPRMVPCLPQEYRVRHDAKNSTVRLTFGRGTWNTDHLKLPHFGFSVDVVNLDNLKQVGASFAKVGTDIVIMHKSEEYPYMARIREKFDVEIAVPSQDTYTICQDKITFARWMTDIGLGKYIPKIITNITENNYRTLPYPVIVKVAQGSYGKGVNVVKESKEFYRLWKKVNQGNTDYLVQEAVISKQEYTHNFAAVHGKIVMYQECFRVDMKEGLFIKGVGDAKVRFTSGFERCSDQEHSSQIQKILQKIVKNSCYHGFGCLQYKIDENTKVIKVIELNPRVCGALNRKVDRFAELIRHFWVEYTNMAAAVMNNDQEFLGMETLGKPNELAPAPDGIKRLTAPPPPPIVKADHTKEIEASKIKDALNLAKIQGSGFHTSHKEPGAPMVQIDKAKVKATQEALKKHHEQAASGHDSKHEDKHASSHHEDKKDEHKNSNSHHSSTHHNDKKHSDSKKKKL